MGKRRYIGRILKQSPVAVTPTPTANSERFRPGLPPRPRAQGDTGADCGASRGLPRNPDEPPASAASAAAHAMVPLKKLLHWSCLCSLVGAVWVPVAICMLAKNYRRRRMAALISQAFEDADRDEEEAEKELLRDADPGPSCEAESQTTRGKVMATVAKQKDGAVSYTFEAAHPAGGRCRVSKSFEETDRAKKWRTGEEVEVGYISSDPQQCMLRGLAERSQLRAVALLCAG